jgi:hypothetical protein
MTATAMLALIPHGVMPYLVGAVAVNVVVAASLIALLILSKGIRPRALVIVLLPPAVASLSAAVLLWLLDSRIADDLPPFAQLMISGPVFMAAYLAVLRLLFRVPLAELVGYLPGGHHVGRLLYLSATQLR